MSDEPETSEVLRYELEALERELRARQSKEDQAIEAIKANFVFHPRARARPIIVHSIVAAHLGVTCSPKFYAWVTELLKRRLGIHLQPGGGRPKDRTKPGRSFLGIGTAEYLAWRLEADEKAYEKMLVTFANAAKISAANRKAKKREADRLLGLTE